MKFLLNIYLLYVAFIFPYIIKAKIIYHNYDETVFFIFTKKILLLPRKIEDIVNVIPNINKTITLPIIMTFDFDCLKDESI